MNIDLFPHNQTAYAAAVSLLAETGKAAIVHPTGTGKSFIGFKLCEDNPDDLICWLSPSEYIFITQLENLKATGADVPHNIVFFTYAKLMLMSEDELAEIQPVYIILDEFHRCGAEQWGKGVERLIDAYADIPILGLSATNIRYLDNQRNMADELFDGNIASEMTLGQAIVRGILNPPKYVLSVFSYQKDLEKYRARARRAKSKAVLDAAEKYLAALRRALDKADGLDVIFEKHMTDRAGKYIVFCANIEHLDEMISHVPEWFGRIDSEPQVYRAYSDDPETSKAFASFKADTSAHLKLLFCIDMLNEGIHVDDISGVILFRPTVSPIIYKQQIGRALCASKKNDPIILDIVNNFENLYSIGAIEQEMQTAIAYYRFLDNEKEIVNQRFQVIDEVRDCKRLFDELNDTLTASWDLMYQCAEYYYRQNSNLEAPYKYKTAEGYSLGHWLHTQRKVRAGELYGKLDEERIAKLDRLGMVWDSYRDLSWERYYTEAQKYYATHGHLNTNVNDISENGLRLGAWICNLRTWRKNNLQNAYMNKDRIAKLDAIGMIWNQPDYLFERNFASALLFYRCNDHLDVPAAYVDEDGVRLGAWIRNLRQKAKGRGAELSPEQIARLDGLGMLWTDKPTRQWETGYEEAVRYQKENGTLDIPTTYITESRYRLGRWISNQREKHANGKLKPEQKSKLDLLGMAWEKTDSWEARFALAKAFFEKNGNLNVPPHYVSEGIWLSKWLNEQRHIILGRRKGKELATEQKERLLSIGFTWKTKNEILWDGYYEEALLFFNEYGRLNVPSDYLCKNGTNLSRWIQTQRRYHNEGKLTPEQIEKLSAIGMVWVIDDPWEIGYEHAKQYYEEHANLSVPNSFVCDDGYRLGSWISNQRNNHNTPKQYHSVSVEQACRLEQIGMVWSPYDTNWESSYQLAVDFFKENGNLRLPNKYRAANDYDLGDWLRQQREKYRNNKLPVEQIDKLNAIAMDWLTPAERMWEDAFLLAEKYYSSHGNLDIPCTYKDKSGFGVGMWVRRQKKALDSLSPTAGNGDRAKRLGAIGMR